MAGMRPCEREFTVTVAQGVHGMVEQLTGHVCPFDMGGVCSVLPHEEEPGVRQQHRQQSA